MPQTIIDLDDIAPAADIVLKIKGVSHPLQEATVESFAANMKAIESLALNASTTEELNVTIGIVKRAFPSLTDEQISGLRLVQLKKIVDFARGSNGEVAETEKVDTAGNAEGAN